VGSGIAVDSVGNAYVVGETDSANFPTAKPAQASCGSSQQDSLSCSLDAFVAKMYTGPNRNPIANAGPDQVVSIGPVCGGYATVNLDGQSSSDPDGDQMQFSWSGSFGIVHGPTPTISLPLGTHVITLTVFDGKGGSASDTVTIRIIDTTPPVVGTVTATPNVLLQANHQMVPTSLAISVSDNCDSSAVCRIVSVVSNEPIEGLGDGDTSPDWTITGNLTVDLRAERSGKGSGRVYTMTVECSDASGNSSTKSVTVTVPRNN